MKSFKKPKESTRWKLVTVTQSTIPNTSHFLTEGFLRSSSIRTCECLQTDHGRLVTFRSHSMQCIWAAESCALFHLRIQAFSRCKYEILTSRTVNGNAGPKPRVRDRSDTCLCHPQEAEHAAAVSRVACRTAAAVRKYEKHKPILHS
jgi:hypothetical protein